MSLPKALIFDLDGVVVSTDELHYQGWKQLADAEGIPFDKHDNERLRGVSRMESLEIILEKCDRKYSVAEKEELAGRKNATYRGLLKNLTPADILPGVTELLEDMRRLGVRSAIGSSSKNAGPILAAIGMSHFFEVVVDGTHIRRSKPDPEVFLLAAQRLGLSPSECVVVEDADAGVDAGVAAGMRVLAVGSAMSHPQATWRAQGLSHFTVAHFGIATGKWRGPGDL